MDYEVRNNLLESENQLYKSELKARLDKIKELSEENRRLSEKNKIYSNALVQEKENNKKLKEERDFFKEQATLWRNDYKSEYEENRKLKEELEQFNKGVKAGTIIIGRQGEEIRKLKEFKAKQEEMMFLIGASIELAEPKTYRDAEKLQKGKEIYEKLYKEELYYLKEENKKLDERIRFLEQCLDNKEKVNKSLREENKRLENEIAEYLDAIRNINH